MDNKTKAFTAIVFASIIVFCRPLPADVRLPALIGPNMVLQRDVQLPVWGWADAGEKVVVKIASQKKSTQTGPDGKWKLTLSPMKAGGPHHMVISGKNTIRINNILVGEIWICSGQSNMALALNSAETGKEEAKKANYPNIRFFTVPRNYARQPLSDIRSRWLVCSPKYAPRFSAVGYFFARELHNELKIPIGMIQAAVGSSRIDAWMPPEAFKPFPQLKGVLKEISDANATHKKNVLAALEAIEKWLPLARKALNGEEPIPSKPLWPTHPLAGLKRPTGLYYGMLHPLAPFAIRGAIWYQGESNRVDGMLYFVKMKALIQHWRSLWNRGVFPFYYVQIAPYRYFKHRSEITNPYFLPKLWEAQTEALSVPNTGMAVTTDITTLGNIHPPNKRDVGKRLALWALARDYGRGGLVFSGPLYRSMKTEGDKIILRFDHVGSGLKSRDGKGLTWFEIAGGDKKYVKALAKIVGDTIVVTSEKIRAPVGVRFGWHEEAQPNLCNREGLPASPFRTDNRQ